MLNGDLLLPAELAVGREHIFGAEREQYSAFPHEGVVETTPAAPAQSPHDTRRCCGCRYEKEITHYTKVTQNL